jgi:3-hydroxyacyl-CoA dehydrogenase
MDQETSIQRVAVVGTGTVGASWAAYFLAHGLDVVATDPGPNARDALFQFVERAWPALTQIGLSKGASFDRLCFASDIAQALEGTQLVQESAPEREQLKIDLLKSIDEHCGPEVIIASSSSGLLISSLQSAMTHPGRCLIAHPFNPPHLMPLVEIVAGEATNPLVVDQALKFYRSIGKHPIHIQREVIGHVANRLQAALFREALHLLDEGVASVADIDAAVMYGPGIRWALMGPFLTLHLAGGEGGIEHFLDHLAEPFNSWFADLGSSFITDQVADLVTQGVEAEAQQRSITALVESRDVQLIKLLTTITPL